MSYPPGAENPRNIRTTRKNQKVLNRVKFDQQSSNSDQAKKNIIEMQKQIEFKTAEVNRLKLMMARNDPSDGTAAQVELNRLASAFEIDNKKAKAKIEPIIAQLHKTKSMYESKIHKMKMFSLASKERQQSVDLMQERIDHVTAELDAPKVLPIDQTPIFSVLHETQKKQCEIEETHRNKQMAAFNERAFSLINEAMNKRLNIQIDAEKHSDKKAKSSRMQNEARINQPEQVIDDEWILARHKLDKLRIMLEDAKRSIKFLGDTAEQLSSSNKRVAEDLARSQDELSTLTKFLPGAPHDELNKKSEGVSRPDLTVLETHTNQIDVILNVGKLKTKSIKSSLDALKSKLAELPELIEKANTSAEQTKNELENKEMELKQAQVLKAELNARKIFAEEEVDVLKLRIQKQLEILANIKQQTNEAKQQIEKQETIMQMNEEMQSLKTMNFDKFTSTIANLMNIRKKI